MSNNCELCVKLVVLTICIIVSIVMARGYVYMLYDIQNGETLCEHVKSNPFYQEFTVRSVYNRTLTNEIHRWSYKYRLFRYFDKDVPYSTSNYAVQPIIFIPGSRGAFENVESLGSISQQIQYNNYSENIYDFYTIDLNHEMSFTSGIIIRNQATFVCDVIYNVLHYYPSIKSVILIGHSMGGTVARYVPITTDCDDSIIALIITLSSPHVFSPVSWDYDLVSTFNKMNSIYYEATHLKNNSHLQLMKRHPDYYNKDAPQRKTAIIDLFSSNHSDLIKKVENINVVSISGGRTDIIVDPPTLIIDGIIQPKYGFTVMTSYIPNIGDTVDHHGIVYCNKWIEKLSLSLYGIYDNKSHNLFNDRYERVDLLADSLLPPAKDYENLYEDLLIGYNGEKDKIPFNFYFARLSLNYAPSSNSAVIVLFYVVIYGLLNNQKNEKLSRMGFCDFLNPLNHFYSIKSTFVFKYIIIITCILQTISYFTQIQFLNISAPNIFGFITLYSAGIGIFTVEYIFGIILLIPLAFIYYLMKILHEYYKNHRKIQLRHKNIENDGNNRNNEDEEDNEDAYGERDNNNKKNNHKDKKLSKSWNNHYKYYGICIITVIGSGAFVLFLYPESITGLYEINEIFKFLLIFFHLNLVIYEVLCLVIIDFSCEDDHFFRYALFSGLRFALFFEQFSLYSLELNFLESPPKSYEWKEMIVFLYSIIMEIPILFAYNSLYRYGIDSFREEFYIPLKTEESCSIDELRVPLTVEECVNSNNNNNKSECSYKSPQHCDIIGEEPPSIDYSTKSLYNNNKEYEEKDNVNNDIESGNNNNNNIEYINEIDDLKFNKIGIISSNLNNYENKSKSNFGRKKYLCVVTEWIMVCSYFFVVDNNFVILPAACIWILLSNIIVGLSGKCNCDKKILI